MIKTMTNVFLITVTVGQISMHFFCLIFMNDCIWKDLELKV